MLKQQVGITFVFCLGLLFANTSLATDPSPKRVISLSPHLTEAIFWLGAGDRLAGRDRFSNYPPEAANVAVVGDAYSLNIEALLAQKPDLILLWQAPQTLQQQIQQFGLPLFNSNPQNLLAIRQELARLATVLGVWPEQKFAELDQQINQLQNQPLAPSPKKALLLVQSQPPVALGNNDALAASLPYCGWQNVLEQTQAAINLSPEFLPSADYDAVINFASENNPYLKPVPQLKPAADPLVRPGPRFAAAMLQLCRQLNSQVKP